MGLRRSWGLQTLQRGPTEAQSLARTPEGRRPPPSSPACSRERGTVQGLLLEGLGRDQMLICHRKGLESRPLPVSMSAPGL